MENQLAHFYGLFPTERELQDALVELFRRVEGVTGVRKLQGALEHGKDIIFYEGRALGGKRLNACVVKNKAITGNVNSSDGARTVMLQVQQALDTPLPNAEGEDERVVHVYVICPRPLTPNALASVTGALKERARQVTFLCGDDLLDIFKDKWPEFLLFEGDFLGRYLNDLQGELNANALQAALSLRHNIVEPANRLLREVYVPQRLSVQVVEIKPRTLSWYPDIFTKPVDFPTVQDAVFNLNILGGVLVNSPLWASSNDGEVQTWVDTAHVFRRLATRILEWWDDGYREFLRQSKDPGLPRNLIEIRLAADPLARLDYQSAMTAAKNCWDAFSGHLKSQHHALARMPPEPFQRLVDPAYPARCALSEAAERSPLAVHRIVRTDSDSVNGDQFLNLTNSLLITAPAGVGKTSFCKYHALLDADRLLLGSDRSLPVFIPLHVLSSRSINTLGDLLSSADHLKQVLFGSRTDVMPFDRVRLYLDGLDEVADEEQRKNIVRIALNAEIAWPIQVVITARDHVYADYLSRLPRVHLSKFNDIEIAQFVRSWLPKADVATDFHAQLSRHPALADLMRIPLLATLIIAVYRRLHHLPDTKVELYSICVDLLCGGWDLIKNVRRECSFSPSVKMTFLKTLAGQLHAKRLREASIDDVEIALGFSLSGLENKSDRILQEILQDALLVRSGRVFLFAHFSFQEYLTAKNLTDPTGQTQRSALKQYLLGDDWWKDVVSFYIGLLDNPFAAHQWLSVTARGMLQSGSNKGVQSEIIRRGRMLEGLIKGAYPDFTLQSAFN